MVWMDWIWGWHGICEVGYGAIYTWPDEDEDEESDNDDDGDDKDYDDACLGSGDSRKNAS